MVDTKALSTAQLDGRACIVCGAERGPMVPITVIIGCQTFTCAGECARQAEAV